MMPARTSLAAALAGALAGVACADFGLGTAEQRVGVGFDAVVVDVDGGGPGSDADADPDAEPDAGSDASLDSDADPMPDAGADGGGGGGTDAAVPPDAGDCTPLSSTIASLIAGTTIFDDATPQDTIDQLEVAVASLVTTCPFDGYCPGDLEALADVVVALSDMPVAGETSQARLDDVLTLQSAAWTALTCMDDAVSDYDGPEPTSFTYTCTVGDWNRRTPYFMNPSLPNFVGCTAIAISSQSGTWHHVGDPTSVVTSPLSAWQRDVDDEGYPLYPASQLLSQLGLSADSVDYMRAVGSYQFSSSLAIAPYLSQIQAAGGAYIIYGRNNSTSTYLMNPLHYVDDGIILEYEYGPEPDSIKILGCPAVELEGWQFLTFGNRQSVESPWNPFIPDQPGVWAILATCPAMPAPSATTTTTTD